MTILTRRGALGGTAAAFAALSAGAPRPVLAAGGQCTVGTWGGDYQDLLIANIDTPLVKPQGIEVLYDVAVAPPRKTKLIAERASRRGSMDVACLSDVDMFEMAQLNLFETIDATRVPNTANVVPALAKPYAIPHIYSGQVILYNPDKVSAPPKSYADLWDPKYRNRVGFADGLYLQVFSSAALVGGGSMSNFEPGKAKLKELRELGARVYPSNEALAVALKGEEVWLTIMWLARGFMWKKGGINITHAVPVEGAQPIVFDMAVPKNARNKDAAYAWLNASLDPKAQVAFADKMGYVNTVTNATLPPELQAQIGFTPEQQANFRKPDYEYIAKNNSQLLDWWNREFKG